MKEKFEFRFSRNFAEITAIVTLSCLLIFYGVLLLWPQGNPYDFVKVTIPKGASLNEVGITLKNNNIIHNKQSFQLAVKILEFYGYESSISFKEKFSTEGGLTAWLGILFTAGFTPLPFKLLTISSGIIHFNLFFFIFICIFTRGLRFFLVAYLAYKFGNKIGPFLEKEGAKWSIVIASIIILVVAAIYLYI